MSKPVHVLMLTKYGRLGASSRLRFLQYVPMLQNMGLQLTGQSLLSDEGLRIRYLRGRYALGVLVGAYVGRFRAMSSRRRFDLLWVEKEALPWMPLWLERLLLSDVPYVLDYDDAVFHQYDQHGRFWARYLFGQRLDRLMSKAALVVVGNSYLAKRAHKANAPWVEILPTAIDLDHYPADPTTPSERVAKMSPPRIVWIGSPSTARYLELLHAPLRELASRHSFVLRLIGCDEINLPGVQVEVVAWSEATEVNDISECEVGIMPLLDTPWEQGKCGYKLIQYMACGLPVVASHVGVNPEIVQPGENGFLAQTPTEWVNALDYLLTDSNLRVAMGRVGRERVEQAYCIQKTGLRLIEWFRAIALRH